MMYGITSHNVPAVYDVLVGRISKPQVCSPAKMWVEGAVEGVADLGEWNPGATKGSGAYTDLLCAVFLFYCLIILFYYFVCIILYYYCLIIG
jgi:hypothetical protein